MSKLYYAVPTLGLIAGILALVLIGMVPTQMANSMSIVLWRTGSVLAFGTANWFIALTYALRNRFGLYANTLLLVTLVTLLVTFGRHTVAPLGLGVFGSLIGVSLLLIVWLHMGIPAEADEKDYR